MNVWKYPLETCDSQTVAMPAGAVIIAVGVQHRQPVMWALVDESERAVEHRVIYAYHTGHYVEPDVLQRRHLGTVQLDDGVAVFHFFE